MFKIEIKVRGDGIDYKWMEIDRVDTIEEGMELGKLILDEIRIRKIGEEG